MPGGAGSHRLMPPSVAEADSVLKQIKDQTIHENTAGNCKHPVSENIWLAYRSEGPLMPDSSPLCGSDPRRYNQ